ncbi:MAG: peptidase U32 [Peptococcaceae bacterium BICA1-7]|nr:MAG: peptidase U32 [Peptococcaceae bacterium BICA1-7]HBV98796.1 peptidase U32 [Desulfotomaculum sp.]
MNKPELLAPAGGWEALVAAVENGADAVYLGGRLFNARQSADNFDDKDLSRAVEYAHLRGARIYVTVNTLIADTEMEEALEFLFTLQSLGADAAILQDMGLASLARRAVPDLPLHASTQMTAHNSPGVLELTGAGFDRVVLAREMSLEEIKEIKKKTGADLEVFIHGALCISYSGQCLLSSMIGGRSGNRGRCAQPCRMQYSLVNGSGRAAAGQDQPGEYLLSPRDLNMSAHLPQLVRAGISSFKIEGRMKRPEYVATVVRVYRNLIDRALSGEPYLMDRQQEEDLAQIFNRDFTTGYFFGNQGKDMMSHKRPNNRGVRLGRVKGYDRNTGLVEVTLERPLKTGDGLEVWVTEGGRVGFTVDNIFLGGERADSAVQGDSVGLKIPGRVRPGDRVFKTHDADLMEQARETYTSPRGARRKVNLEFTVEGGPGEPLVITATDPEGRTASAATGTSGQEAERRPLDREYLKEMLGRLGNTPFTVSHLTCDIKGRVIYPASEINQARRQVTSLLEKMILKDRGRQRQGGESFRSGLGLLLKGENRNKAVYRGTPLLSVSVGDLPSLRAAVEAGADIVYLGPAGFQSKPPVGREALLEASAVCREEGKSLVLSTPRIIKDSEMDNILQLLAEVPADGAQAGNPGILRELAKRLPDLPLFTDFGFNAYNMHTVNYLLGRGALRVTLSPELTMAQVKRLAGLYPVEVFVQGALELMVSDHCLTGTVLSGGSPGSACPGECRKGGYSLKDRTGAQFPVETDRYCRMHLFNSRDLCLVEDLPELAGAGVGCVRIEARRENHRYVSQVTGIYRKVLDRQASGGGKKIPGLEAARERLEGLSPAGITKGHYYRGV